MNRLESLVNRCWYGRGLACALARWCLAPLGGLFWLAVKLRAWAYRQGGFKAERLPVTVVGGGNITAGGAGKTPLTLALVAWLRQAGLHPGIISRGYGGRAEGPMAVSPDTDPALTGDEPVLMARRAGCPVWVGRRRAEAGRRLLASHPEVDVLVADDGLQHLALARDLEIAVVDGTRGLGNGWLLPCGPLREPASRLAGLDAVVVNGPRDGAPVYPVPTYAMALRGERFRNLLNPGEVLSAADLAGGPIHALAGIGHPQRFFDLLAGMGLAVVPHAFPDHHVFVADDLPTGPLVMTEKDAVKVAPLVQALNRRDAWYLPVDAALEPGLKDLILSRMRELTGLNNNGSQTA